MQLYFPNFNTQQAAIGIFDYLIASRDSSNANVIFDSDLNLENLSNIPGGTPSIKNTVIQNSQFLYSFLGFVITNYKLHNAQLFQDLYVLWKCNNKKNGTFVEVGTGFPTGLNNTWMLESQHLWHGICIEPNPNFSQQIKQQRTSNFIQKAISSQNTVKLKVPVNFSPGGGIETDFEPKVGSPDDTQYSIIDVQSISLYNCLLENNIDKNFDYLSYDTTGNADDIVCIQEALLAGYRPSIITIGHNYKSHRKSLNSMLQSFGYHQEFEYLSRWDDWYSLS